MKLSKKYCYVSATVKCPFYRHEERRHIACQGYDSKSFMHITFKRTGEAGMHKEQYCQEKYKECPIYQLITKKASK